MITMSQESAAECRQRMFDHLRSKGFPDMTDQGILDELPAMHQQLLDAKLIPCAFTLEIFRKMAIEVGRQVRLFEQLQGQAGARAV
jgi:hypothetical protein